MKAGNRFPLAFAVLLGLALLLPSVGEAKRYNLVREPNGKVRLVDPEDTFMNRLTHPWRFFRRPYNYVRKSVLPPPQKTLGGFGREINQREMETKPSIPSRISTRVDGAVSTVNSVPVVKKITNPFSRFFGKKKNAPPRAGSPGN